MISGGGDAAGGMIGFSYFKKVFSKTLPNLPDSIFLRHVAVFERRTEHLLCFCSSDTYSERW